MLGLCLKVINQIMAINQLQSYYSLALIIVCLACYSCTYDVYNHDNSIGSGYYQQYPSNYQQYNAPRSRIYNNPYKTPPRNYYPYYDYDYYYIPPANYRNTEPYSSGGLETNSGPDNTKY